MRKRNSFNFICLTAGLLILAVCTAAIFTSLGGFRDSFSDKRAQQVKEAVISCAAQCYALEGKYPSDLNYLAEHYGLQLDYQRYSYYYEIFATNIFPDVKVFVKDDGE